MARRSWPALAKLVLAGPQYRRSGTIRLRIVPGGFATVASPDLSVVGDRVAGVAVDGLTLAEVAEQVGVDLGAPSGLYKDGSGPATASPCPTRPRWARRWAGPIWRCGHSRRRVPRDFDVSITLDEVNYGVSLGDGYLAEPYAYVGPFQPRTGEFWNAPFGAARPLRDRPDIAAFFASGR